MRERNKVEAQSQGCPHRKANGLDHELPGTVGHVGHPDRWCCYVLCKKEPYPTDSHPGKKQLLESRVFADAARQSMI